MIDKIQSILNRWPKLTCTIAGLISAFAMAPTYVWPTIMLSLAIVIAVMNRVENKWRGAWCIFCFGMGYFTLSLWWVSNALLMDLDLYWWAMGFSILGLPLLLSILWFVAGWITIRFTSPGTLARAVLLLTLIGAAEYGRAFNLTGFPWNLFAYTWGNVAPVMQLASVGGAYLVLVFTLFWMGAPSLAALAGPRKTLRYSILAGAVVTFAATFAWGSWRLDTHPTEWREDVALVIVQPNITPDEKWETDKVFDHFMRHITLAQDGLAALEVTPQLKSIAVVWPETSLEERLIMGVPEAARELRDMLESAPVPAALVSGVWREEAPDPRTGRPSYYNSIGTISVTQDRLLNLDDLYDKHHLVPFGEFLPMEQTLGLTPVVGFAGFKWGPGPKTIHSPIVPPVAPMICFEAIFPWYGYSKGAEWLVNTSNDGWYGDTPGPYQHLAMTRFRAVEQGKPIARSATTGISAVIDSYGRATQTVAYQKPGTIVSALPKVDAEGTTYTRFGEMPFFLSLVMGLAIAGLLHRRKI